MNRLIFLLTTLLLLSACSDEPNIDYGDFREAFVTNTGNNILAYRAQNDSPLIRLHADKWDNEKVKPGERAVIRYTIIDKVGDREYNVRIDDWGSLFCDKLRQASIEIINSYNAQPTNIISIWRSGQYINSISWVPMVPTGAKITLIADENDIDSEVPKLHLIYHVGDLKPTFDRKCYASFDIANLWNRETCKGVEIVATTTAGPKSFFFSK